MRCKNIEIVLLNGEIITIYPYDHVTFKKGCSGLGQFNQNRCCDNNGVTEEKLIRFLEQNCNGCGIIEIKNCHEVIDIMAKQVCTVKFENE